VRTALQHARGDPLVQLQLADILLAKGESEAAIELYEAAAVAAPASAAAFFNRLGNALLAAGQAEAAGAAFARALSAEPVNPFYKVRWQNASERAGRSPKGDI